MKKQEDRSFMFLNEKENYPSNLYVLAFGVWGGVVFCFVPF